MRHDFGLAQSSLPRAVSRLARLQPKTLISRIIPLQIWAALARTLGNRISLSQHGEDEFLLDIGIFSQDTALTIMEVGSFNGIRYSPSVLFESSYQTQTFLVEASPKNAFLSRRYRPSAQVLCAAVAESSRIELFCGDRAVSGLSRHLSTDYLSRWGLYTAKNYAVPTVSLKQVFDFFGLATIDFLSIDIQGGELEALKGINWEVHVRVISIELEGENPKRDEECRKILRRNGFNIAERCGINEVWVHEDESWQEHSFPKTRVVRRLRPFNTRKETLNDSYPHGQS